VISFSLAAEQRHTGGLVLLPLVPGGSVRKGGKTGPEEDDLLTRIQKISEPLPYPHLAAPTPV
jgi:hypothetical protein